MPFVTINGNVGRLVDSNNVPYAAVFARDDVKIKAG